MPINTASVLRPSSRGMVEAAGAQRPGAEALLLHTDHRHPVLGLKLAVLSRLHRLRRVYTLR